MAYVNAQVTIALDGANAAVTHAQLHTGPPGAAGTSNVAAASSRIACDLPAASGTPPTSSLLVTFTITGASAALTNVSLWDAASGGTFLGEGTLSPQESFAGAGELDVTVNTAATST